MAVVLALLVGAVVYVDHTHQGSTTSGNNLTALGPTLLGGVGDASSNSVHVAGGQPPAGVEEAAS
ncbi:MAG TPA: hypothetical protein VIJ47_15300, partial [Acidimicrobiales bacterium]